MSLLKYTVGPIHERHCSSVLLEAHDQSISSINQSNDDFTCRSNKKVSGSEKC